ncbi:hypothetical protein PHJA_003002600 [Phtheirospermum japonicum]|uniref:Uncharacterized protein n=1 Tax=Phtheirospermum japonicum TaxID=374723 RepID=A0A830DPI6_9LAMI|nr:hypothetical protein PHJA_003002600 [Phtheirospermum japonicum]
MSMSIFSSFDALCAESFFGQKISLFKGPAPSSDNNKQAPALKFDDQKRGKDVNSCPSQPEKKLGDRRRFRGPRFAPELDGVHCFETIVPC